MKTVSATTYLLVDLETVFVKHVLGADTPEEVDQILDLVEAVVADWRREQQ